MTAGRATIAWLGCVCAAACSPWEVDLRAPHSAAADSSDSAPPTSTDSGFVPEPLCSANTLVQGTAVVRFEAYDSICPWMYEDNLYPISSHVTARVEQEGFVPLPSGATLCGLTLTGVGWEDATPPYDDHFLLLVGDVVVMSSSAQLVQPLWATDGLPHYDWSLLAGEPMDANPPEPWCLASGTAPACDIPTAEAPGPLLTALDDQAVADLRPLVSAPLGVSLVVVGDNDVTEDCQHASIDVTVGWQVSLE